MKSEKIDTRAGKWWTFLRRNLTKDQFSFLVVVVDYDFFVAAKTAEIPAEDAERFRELCEVTQKRLDATTQPVNLPDLARRFRLSFDLSNPAQTVRFIKRNFDANDK